MQVIIYLVLASIVYTKDENITKNPNPEHQIGKINGLHKGNELAKQGVLADAFTGEHVKTKSPQSCRQDQLDAMQKRMCNHTHLSRFGNRGAMICLDNVIYVLDCNCVTYDSDKCSVLLGVCPYGSVWIYKKRVKLEGAIFLSFARKLKQIQLYAMCGRLNRDGPILMCSKCRKDFSPLVYSYDLKCVPCKNSQYNWLKFTAVAFVPLTFFYFIVILFRIDATSPYLYGFINLNQALASPISLRGIFTLKRDYLLGARILAIPYTIWNLDFFSLSPTEYLP